MKAYWWNGCTAPRILDLGTRRKWVVSFTTRISDRKYKLQEIDLRTPPKKKKKSGQRF